MAKIIILVGPSGSGKTAVAEALIRMNKCVKITTCTTREPRPGEINGIHYHFMSKLSFDAYNDDGEFIETFEYAGHHYGTRKKDIEDLIKKSETDIIIVMELNGAKAIKQMFPKDTKMVYLKRDYRGLIMAILEREIPDADKADRIVQLQNDLMVEYDPEIDLIVENKTGELLCTVRKIEGILKES